MIKLKRGQLYHIYNRGNNGENLFRERRNYRYFLTLYQRHIDPIADMYAYCLLKNHFHLLVYLKTEDEIREATESANSKKVPALLKRPPSRAFANLFNAYAKTINNSYGRTGALFERPFHRRLVTTNSYFQKLVVYIHRNPQHHRFVDDFREWPYSSYHALTANSPTAPTAHDKPINQFEEADTFIAQHHAPINLGELDFT